VALLKVVDEVAVVSRPFGIVVDFGMAESADTHKCFYGAEVLSSFCFVMNLIASIPADLAFIVFV
jgi:hypothetical protein